MSALLIVAGTVLGADDSAPGQAKESGVGITVAESLDAPPGFDLVWRIAREAWRPADPRGVFRRPLTNCSFEAGFGCSVDSIRVTWFDRNRVGSEDDLRAFLQNFLEEPVEQVLSEWRWSDFGSPPLIKAIVTDQAGATNALVIESLGSPLRTSFRNSRGVWKFGMHRAPSLRIASQRPEVQLPKLADPDPEVRSKAVAFLAQCGVGDEQVGRGLIPLLRDQDPKIRGMAAYALGCVGTPVESIVTGLIEILGDDQASVRVEAARSLGNFAAESGRSIPPLLKLLADADPDVRSGACWALGKLGAAVGAESGPPIVEAMIGRLDDADSNVRSSAVSALGEMSARSIPALPRISQLRSDPNESVAMRAREVVQALKSVQATQ